MKTTSKTKTASKKNSARAPKPSRTMATIEVPALTIGIDLGDKRHAICVMDGAGETLEERTIANDREALARMSSRHAGALIVMEVGTHSPWVSRFLKELGHEVIVANPRKVAMIHKNERKSDRNDARLLAEFGRVSPRMLHPIEHGSEESQRDLLQVKLRDAIVRQRVDLISMVRSTLKSLGVRVPSPNTNYFAKQARAALAADHAGDLVLVEDILQVIDAMTEKIKVLTKKIGDTVEEKYPAAKRLMQIRGVGPITALTFVLTVDDPTRFEKSRDVGPYLGLVPKRDQSGAVDKELRISKAGDAYLRRLLVGAAQYILGPFGEDCDLRRRGLALAERGGQGAKKKAVIATARKLAVLMHALWTSGTDYEALRGAATDGATDSAIATPVEAGEEAAAA